MFLVLADVTPFVFNPFKTIYLLLVFANLPLFVYGPCFSFVPQIFVYVEIDLWLHGINHTIMCYYNHTSIQLIDL